MTELEGPDRFKDFKFCNGFLATERCVHAPLGQEYMKSGGEWDARVGKRSCGEGARVCKQTCAYCA